ncbi:DMT family transporter [Rhizobium helianthi]|uniref:DMT family transporter n=1 Tax=Rhizobium helianthi TaxID=1132695 RepID=A0ABW4M451_9HYPH
MRPRDLLIYIFLSVAWGLSFLLLLHVIAAFGWVGSVTFRCLLAGAILLVLARLTGRKLSFGSRWKPLAVVGATTVAGQLIGLSYATPLIGTAMAAIFVATIPLFSMLIARLWGMEMITPPRILGLALGTLGIIMLVGFPAVPVTPSFILGCAAMVFGTFCAAFGSNYAHRHLGDTGAWEVTIGAFFFGGLMSLPLLLLVPVPGIPQIQDYLYLLVQAGVMSAMTYVLYFSLVGSIGPTRAISVEFVVTVIAVLVGALALHEPITAAQLAGGVVIIAGCALVLGIFPAKDKMPLQP